MCCNTETEDANQFCNLFQTQNTDTRLTSPITDPMIPDSSEENTIFILPLLWLKQAVIPDLPLLQQTSAPANQSGQGGKTQIHKNLN